MGNSGCKGKKSPEDRGAQTDASRILQDFVFFGAAVQKGDGLEKKEDEEEAEKRDGDDIICLIS